jgi:Hpt domain
MPEIEARLAELRVAYFATLPELLDEFDAGVLRCKSGVTEARDGLRAIAHRLAGTGALYGATALTVWGKETERIARDGALEQLEIAAAGLRQIIGSLR